MQSPIDSALIGFPSRSPNGKRIPWYMVIVGCVYFLWLAFGSVKGLPIFAELFSGLGLDPPLPTRLLLSSGRWFLPIVYTAGAILTVAKRQVESDKQQARIVNIVLILAGAVLPALVLWVMYLPLFDLVKKLQGAH